MDAIPIPWPVAFSLNAIAVATLGAMAGAWWQRRRERRMDIPARRRWLMLVRRFARRG